MSPRTAKASFFLALALQAAMASLPVRPASALEFSPAMQPLPDCRYRLESLSTFPATAPTYQRRAFPNGDLFRPLLADPKQPQFVISRQRVDVRRDGEFVGGWVAFGESFGIYRYVGQRPCNGWQLNIEGGVFAQFDLTSESNDLVNADYIVGFPASFRRHDFSGRLRFYHQSSHLGDEFLLGSPGIERVNLTFEELELLASYEPRRFRAYGGAGYLIHREPDLDRWKWQYGFEVRAPISETISTRFVPYPVYFVMGADIKQFQQLGYDVNFSLKSGFEIVSNLSDRRFRILFDYYNGFNPFGQFFDQQLKAFGVEVNFGF